MIETRLAFELGDIKAGVRITSRIYHEQAEEYAAYAEACADSRPADDTSERRPEYSLGARFVIDATLRVLTIPMVAERMPRELGNRASMADECSSHIAHWAGLQRIIPSIYKQHPKLRKLVETRGTYLTYPLNSPHIIGKLAAAVAADSSYLIGGAVRALRNHPEIDSRLTPYQAIPALKRSDGLLVFSTTDKNPDRKAELKAIFGIPYVDPSMLQVEFDESGPAVDFTKEARSLLIKQFHLKGGGCPVRHFPPAPAIFGFEGTFNFDIEKSWSDMIKLLVTDTTTVDII